MIEKHRPATSPLILAYFVASLTSAMTAVAVSVFAARHGHGAAAVSSILLCNAIANIALVPLVVPIFDGWSPRRVALFASVVDLASLALILILPSFPVLLVCTVIGSTTAGIMGPAIYHLVSLMGPDSGEHAEAKGYARLDTARLLGGLIGPGIGGALFQLGGLGLAVSTEMAATTIMGCCLAVFAPGGRPATAEHGGQQSFISRITQAPRLLLQNPASRHAFQIVWSAIIFTSIYNVALVFFALDTLRAGGITFAVLTQAFMVGRLLGARVASRLDGQHAARVLTTGGIVMGLALLAVGFGRNLSASIALLFVAGICNSGQVSALRLTVSSAVPAAVRPKAFSTMGSTNSAAMLIGYALGGPVVNCLGAANAFVLSGCGTAALTAVFSARYLTTDRSSLRFPGHPCSHE
ncbi:hypothetical protein DLJ54_04065 [Corynebacterium heidelbergense]|uniref:Major facilitator superfamily (MFS) profile domain-containing protein n=1 Tax=Corynebacterium heidelbergense TaxID=2055947 RepID=A0A364V6P6_9CORY|nr:hypothetical protein DLJ54_04065 [Corynebacterium heidelbergense]